MAKIFVNQLFSTYPVPLDTQYLGISYLRSIINKLMELKVRIGYEELLKLIQQLPKEQLSSLKNELEKFGKDKSIGGASRLKELALSGPLMSEEQLGLFQDFRRELNKWREE